MPFCPHCGEDRPAQGLFQHVKSCARHPGNEALRKMYLDESMTIKGISEAVGMPNGYNSVRRWLIEAGVQIRNGNKPSQAKPKKWKSNVEALRGHVHHSKTGCSGCSVERRGRCLASARGGAPVECEGPLVAGKIVELPEWLARGWIAYDQIGEELYEQVCKTA